MENLLYLGVPILKRITVRLKEMPWENLDAVDLIRETD